MELQMPQIKFKEYTELNFLGNYGDYSPEKSNNRFPFLGYRAYSEEALPIIIKFSAEEYNSIYQKVDINTKKWLDRRYDKQNDGSLQLNLKEAGLADQQRIWNLFRETPYISSYYRCLPYLLPDDSKAEVINNKYVYTFKQVKNGGFTSIYREFFVKEGKYYQSKIEREEITTEQEVISSPNNEVPGQHIAKDSNQNSDSEPKLIVETVIKNEEVKYRYFMRENRTFSASPTKNISPPKKNGKVEYEYIYILSKVQLSLARIYTIRKEIEQGTCKRGARASFFDHADAYESFRRYASNFIRKEADRVKKNLPSQLKELLKKIPHFAHSLDMIAFMEKEKHLIPHNYEDILYNGPYNQSDDSNHTIYLIDYQSYIWKLKTDFDKKVKAYYDFMEKRNEKGYKNSELNALAEHIAGLVKENENDTEDMKDFKNDLRDELRQDKKKYCYETWKTEYDNSLKLLKEKIEIYGGLLASAVDTRVFTALNFDYHFLLKKNNISNEDKILVDDMDSISSEISLTLQQSIAGRRLLYKKAHTSLKNSTELSKYKKDKIDVRLLYDNFYTTDDWFTLIITPGITKKITLTMSMMSSIILSIFGKETRIEEINRLLAFQKVKLITNNGKGKAKKARVNAINKSKGKLPEMFGNDTYMNESATYKVIKRTKKEIITEIRRIDTVEITKNKKIYVDLKESLAILQIGVELWNLYSSYETYSNIKDINLYSTEYINCLGALTDTTSAILELSKAAGKATLFLNIISSSIDWHVSTKKMQEAYSKNDNLTAMYHQISASASAILAVSFVMIAITHYITGIQIGAILGTPGIVISIIVVTIILLCNYLAMLYSKNDYELFFSHCYWGKNFGDGTHIPHFSEVAFEDWDNSKKGIEYQLKAFYRLFCKPTMRFNLLRDHEIKKTELGVDINPKYLNLKSIIYISAKISSTGYKADSYKLPSTIIKTENFYDKNSSLSKNKGIEVKKIEKGIAMITKIMLRWTDCSLSNEEKLKKLYINHKTLTSEIELSDQVGEPTLEVDLKLDLFGNKKHIISISQKFTIDWLSELEKKIIEKEGRYRG